MTFFSEVQKAKLLNNGCPENRDKDHSPVAMVTIPFTNCVWLLSELDPEETNIAFGLCDLGLGFPELGYVDIDEILSVRHPFFPNVKAICDPHFEGMFPMSVYADAAREFSKITTDEAVLQKFDTTNGEMKP